MKLPIKFKINMYDGVKYSKWILRKAYEDVIPKDIIWRPKAPLEAGTGTETLRTYFNDMSYRQRFERKKQPLKQKTTLKSKIKNNYSTTNYFRKNSANQKMYFQKLQAPSNVLNATATSKLKSSSAKPAELTLSNLSFYFFVN